MNNKSFPPAIFLMGPTASGKTNAAIALLQRFPVELLSVDSAQVYQGMDIGTAKPDAETLIKAPHHLIDIMPPTEAYSAADFRKDALSLMHDITKRGSVPVLVGGTMLYFKALEEGLSGLPEADASVRAQLDKEANQVGWPVMHERLAVIDPKTAARLKPNDMQRIQRALEVYTLTGKTMTCLFDEQKNEQLPFNVLKIALVPSERKVLHQRIAERFEHMLTNGLVDEVEKLLVKYPSLTAESTAMRCVGYRQALAYINGEYDETVLRDRGVYATRQLAKRQLTWMRGMRDVTELDCLRVDLNEAVIDRVQQFIDS